MARGFFLTFEGLDGSGKTTQIYRLKVWLESVGERVLTTRQPGGTAIGDRIRAVLLDSRTENLAPLAELGLMFADRAQAIAQVMAPALDRGELVLCDRFTDSTEAYQGGGRELGSEVVLDLHRTICGGLQPDLTILLRTNLDDALRRARLRQRRKNGAAANEDRFENQEDAFHRRVLDAYLAIARREPVRVVVIDGDQSIDEVHQDIVRLLRERLGDRLQAAATARSFGAS